MGANSEISWTDHTFNPWWGCTRVSPACDHCYAETFSKRMGFSIWGDTPRRMLSEHNWLQPEKWNRAAAAAGVPARVFCASMADVFECREDLDPLRERLWELIYRTPSLIWMLLTKRPHRVRHDVPAGWTHGLAGGWPPNVWIGTTVEDRTSMRKRLHHLIELPAPVRFVSCEPLLEDLHTFLEGSGIQWVICGGESGPHARPMHPLWVRKLRDQCVRAAIPFHFKQWGEWAPRGPALPPADGSPHFSAVANPETFERVGKAAAGRLLDGREWNEFPA